MAVVRNGDYWVFEWQYKGQRIRRSSGFKVTEVPREHVQKLEEQRREEVFRKELGVRIMPDRVPTLLQALDRIYNEKWSKQRDSEGPRRQIEYLAEHVVGNVKIDEITSRTLSNIKYHIIHERGLSPSTANRYLAAMTGLLRHAAEEWEVLESVPHVKRPSEAGTERVRIVEWDEEAKILEALDKLGDHDFRDLFIFLIDTGVRKGEALGLEYRTGVDFARGLIIVRTFKNDTNPTRSIPMSVRVKEVLTRRRELGDRPFSSFSEWEPLKRLTRACEEAGLPTAGEDKIVLHSLRHTFASRLVRAGVPIYEMSKLLGHSSVVTTQRFYAHLNADTLRSSINVLDNEVKRNLEEDLSPTKAPTKRALKR